jgi:two-component system sensor histidine kinase BaeS
VPRLWEWAVPVAIVVALFAAFVVAQAAALFGGHDYVSSTTGLTYAEYVHEGFGQLTAATGLTLATVAVAVRKAPRATGRERLVLRGMLGALCLLTLVVVASALHRMDLYQQAYGFTVLRLVVDGLELWLGLLVVLVLVAGVRLSAPWLPRVALLAAAALLLGAGLANPEAWVAQRNIDRLGSTGRIDLGYLSTLGPDATPTIVAGLPAALASCALHGRPARAQDVPPSPLTWNLGRARAATALAGLPVSHDPASCTTWLRDGYSR